MFAEEAIGLQHRIIIGAGGSGGAGGGIGAHSVPAGATGSGMTALPPSGR